MVTIKLSENQENVLQTDQTYLTMIVETHFQVDFKFLATCFRLTFVVNILRWFFLQMNYSSGQWTRIKKYRRMEEQQQQQQQ